MGITTGILLFPDAEELDFVGPYEVFTMARDYLFEDDRVVTIAQDDAPVRAAKGMRVLPDHTIEDAPSLDVLVVPGGIGTRAQAENRVLLGWIAKAAAECRFVTSVCTGSLLLHAAGVVAGRRITTHWAFVEELRGRGAAPVMEDVRYVRDGNLVTSAGVSAGIDMSLWLVGQLHDPDAARRTQRLMEYSPAPPYAALV